mmetsp:Transcript_26348/g.69280  ORF Transcript_26348/g.69280 Transcript_26348/m.69280 type:complete len:86 (+) Transcript_26348:485-742(+)
MIENLTNVLSVCLAAAVRGREGQRECGAGGGGTGRGHVVPSPRLRVVPAGFEFVCWKRASLANHGLSAESQFTTASGRLHYFIDM